MKPPMIPLTSHTPRLRQHVLRSPVARRRANTLPTKAAQIPMALRHHERTLATLLAPALQGPFPYYFCTTTWPLLSPAPKRSFPYYICATNWPLLSPSERLSPLLSPAPKSSFPYYFCTTNWPLLSPAPKSSFPHYICTTNWPLLTPIPLRTDR